MTETAQEAATAQEEDKRTVVRTQKVKLSLIHI